MDVNSEVDKIMRHFDLSIRFLYWKIKGSLVSVGNYVYNVIDLYT